MVYRRRGWGLEALECCTVVEFGDLGHKNAVQFGWLGTLPPDGGKQPEKENPNFRCLRFNCPKCVQWIISGLAWGPATGDAKLLSRRPVWVARELTPRWGPTT